MRSTDDPGQRSPTSLAARELRYQYDDGSGLHGVNLNVAAGQVLALVGLNGAGKTTLMRLLLGMLRPQGGAATVQGVQARTAGPKTWAAVGHLVDAPLTYPELDVRHNLTCAARLHGLSPTETPAAVERVMEEFELVRHASKRARTLSQGNRQRLGLAAAVVHDPAVIVLDEPTNALDPSGVILVRESLRRRRDQGAGVLASSHHLDEVARVADRITVINAGRLIGELDPAGVDIERAFFDLVHADDGGLL